MTVEDCGQSSHYHVDMDLAHKAFRRLRDESILNGSCYGMSSDRELALWLAINNVVQSEHSQVLHSDRHFSGWFWEGIHRRLLIPSSLCLSILLLELVHSNSQVYTLSKWHWEALLTHFESSTYTSRLKVIAIFVDAMKSVKAFDDSQLATFLRDRLVSSSSTLMNTLLSYWDNEGHRDASSSDIAKYSVASLSMLVSPAYRIIGPNAHTNFHTILVRTDDYDVTQASDLIIPFDAETELRPVRSLLFAFFEAIGLESLTSDRRLPVNVRVKLVSEISVYRVHAELEILNRIKANIGQNVTCKDKKELEQQIEERMQRLDDCAKVAACLVEEGKSDFITFCSTFVLAIKNSKYYFRLQ